MVSWLMNYIAPNLISSIAYASNAYAVWNGLIERFYKINYSRSFNMHRQIAALTQGTSFISIYFSKLKDLWDQFEALVPPPSCDCVKPKDYMVYLHR